MRSNDEIINLLKVLKEEKGYTLTELSEKVGMAKSALSRYFNKTREFPLNRVNEFANALGVSPEYILGFENPDIATIYNQLEPPRQQKVYSYAEKQLEEQNNIVSFPVYGKTAAGTTPVTYGDPDVEHKDFSSVPAGADVALVVSGDSMEPLISDGSIVFYKIQPHVENGEIAIVEIEGDGVTCKRVKFDYENEKIILQSENDKYEDMVFNNDQIRILGKVLL